MPQIQKFAPNPSQLHTNYILSLGGNSVYNKLNAFVCSSLIYNYVIPSAFVSYKIAFILYKGSPGELYVI